MVGFGKTNLVKLIYLVDEENCRARRETFAGLKWVFYHCGAYSFGIGAALAELAFDIPQ